MQPLKNEWPGGEHMMCLALAELEALQQKTDAGPEFLLNKLRLGQWSASDLVEILRWGLIGGGMGHIEAEGLVLRLFGQHPLGAFKVAALRLLAHAMYGPEDDDLGEGAPVTETPGEQKTGSGVSRDFMAPAP